MTGAYQGTLSQSEPLYTFLADHVLREMLGIKVAEPVLDIYAMHDAAVIFRYVERQTQTALICKFFGNRLIRDASGDRFTLEPDTHSPSNQQSAVIGTTDAGAAHSHV
jgi:hypothetical protein